MNKSFFKKRMWLWNKKTMLIGSFLILLCTGCRQAAQAEPVTKNGFFFDTTIGITIYDETLSTDAKSELLDQCFVLCSNYEKLLSRTVEGSDIYRINHAGGAPVTISSETASLIRKALSYSERTNGVFDCSIAPLSILWNFHGDTHAVPSQTAIDEARSHVNYRRIVLSDVARAETYADVAQPETSGDSVTVTLTDPDMALDLGGIAKGYIADQLSAFLASSGVKSALINLGGNVLTLGFKPDGSPFHVGIQRPFSTTGELITSAPLSNQTLVTSGVYERYFEEDGKLYHHLLNPATGYPFENHLYSVTILCASSADADALSTSCFGLGLTDGMKLVESLDDVEAVFVTDDYQLHYSSGFPQSNE